MTAADDNEDDLQEEPEEADLEDLDAEELLVADLDPDELLAEDLSEGLEDEEPAVADDVEDAEDEPVRAPTAGRKRRATDDEEEDDDEEEFDDDVEVTLDVILKERLLAAEVDEDPEEPSDGEDRSDGSQRVLPKQPDEFVCQSCFLVKNRAQLADPTKELCRDCI